MPSHIMKDIAFFAGIHLENSYMINLYECDMSMVINTDNVREQRVAIERVTHFVSNYLTNCVMVSSTDKAAIEKYEAAGLRLCVLPEEPYDQLLGLVLLNKLNAIMEDKIVITDMTFGSKLSDYIKFHITQEEAETVYPEKAWYNDCSVAIKETPKKKKDKVVKLFEPDEWEKFDLTWQEKKA